MSRGFRETSGYPTLAAVLLVPARSSPLLEVCKSREVYGCELSLF